MSKFCSQCGTPCAEDAGFCQNCGNRLKPAAQAPQYQAPQQPQYQEPQYQAPQQPQYQEPQYQAPQQPQYQEPQYQAPPQPQYQEPQYQAPQQPQYQQPYYQAPQYGYPPAAQKSTSNVSMIRNIIIIAVAIFAFVIGYLNISGEYDLSVTVSAMGQEKSTEGSIADARDNINNEEVPSQLEGIATNLSIFCNSTYVLGAASIFGGIILLIAACLSFMQKNPAKSLFFTGAVIFALGSIIALAMTLLTSSSTMSMSSYGMPIDASVDLSIHWSYWAAAAAGVGVTIVGGLLFKQEPQPAPATYY